MRRILLFVLMVVVLGILGYPFYYRLGRVHEKQQAQETFSRRVKRSLPGRYGSGEWRWRDERRQFLRSAGETREKNPIEARFLEKLNFTGGNLPKEAPEFSLRDLDGKTWTSEDLRGHWVILNFWATWCPSCRQEMPSIQRLWETYQSHNFIIAGINVQESRSSANQFADSYDITFPVLLDKQGTVATKYKVTGIPETVVIAPNGRVLGKATGYRLWDKKPVRSFFDSVLKK